MPWVLRGLRNGVVTSRYPRRPDPYGDAWRASVSPRGRGEVEPELLESVCPTGAIVATDEAVGIDRGRCISCGRCVRAFGSSFTWVLGAEVAATGRKDLLVPRPESSDDEAEVAAARDDLSARVRALGRSVHVRHVDAGSDGSEEWELQALWNPVYDVQRLGIYLTASPRHADVLVVTGAGAHGMAEAVRTTYDAMPRPRVVLAVGTDAISGGLVAPNYAVRGGVGDIVPVDVWVPGSPPSPLSILHGLLLALGRVPERGDRP